MRKTILVVFVIASIFKSNINIAQSRQGFPDSSFGTDGQSITIFPHSQSGYISGIAIQPDNKIVAVGTASNKKTGGFLFALSRYNYDGSLDSSFGKNGISIDTIANNFSQATGIVLQSDGKIVVCGTVTTNSHTVFAVARFNTNGSLDKTFGISGADTTNIGHNSQAKAITIDSDGSLIVAGYTYVNLDVSPYVISNFAIAKYKSNGFLDSSFGINGIDTAGGFSAGNPVANAVSIQADGKIIVAGNYEDYSKSQPLSALARYNANGTVDSLFGINGLQTTGIGLECFSQAMALQNDGKIVTAGYSYDNGTGESFNVIRYNNNGILDSSFGTDGITITGFDHFTGEGTGSSQAYTVSAEDDGRLLAGGTGSNYYFKTGAFELACYDSAGALDNTFGQKKNGEVTTKFSGKIDDGATALKISNARIYLAGQSDNHFAIAAYINNALSAPTITTIPANVKNLCPATTVTLTSSSTTGNTWSTGATTQSITTDTAGSYSVTVNGKTSAVTNVIYKTCTKPKSTGVSAVTSTTATVYWSKEPCKSDYTLEYRKVGTSAFTTVTANDTLHKITGLLPSTNYQWKIRTVCVDTPLTASDYTTFASFTTTSGFADGKITEENNFSIVPNPAHTLITVSFVTNNANTILQVINATGQSIIQKQITSFSGKNTAQLDISKLAAGIYMLLVKTKSGVELKRFVKE